jgi:hypothetical protein
MTREICERMFLIGAQFFHQVRINIIVVLEGDVETHTGHFIIMTNLVIKYV